MNIFKKNSTFRPKKRIPEGTKQYQLKKYADASLGSGNLKLAVTLPENEDINEWFAVHTVDFYNQLNMFYGSIHEHCTEENCPIMSAGKKYEYYWADGIKVKKPIQVSAPEYITRLMDWVQGYLDNEKIFPSDMSISFPKNFTNIVKNIFRRLFRVYAHMYHNHFTEIISLGEEAHLNTSFKHFVYFITEYRLIDKKELAPMQDLINSFLENDEEMKTKKKKKKKKK
ncbi:mob kinase activator-like 1 [Anaeramoeba flamelloides]|uniref:Mob kinase activator-like 1 n=1 Tax=Anaeramoeba flamelloides TaxID=1746091 RepID=A0ABQ8Y3I9_9EUKA|nr:mob kinase activator-like 1 [Anaeramoeba flamelloides]